MLVPRLQRLAVVLLTATAATPGRAVELAWRLDADDELQIVVERSTTSRSGEGDTLVERTSRQQLFSTWKCLGRNARGEMAIEAVLTRGVFEQSLGEDSTRYDTSKPETAALAPNIAAIYGVIVGRTFQVAMDARGSFLSARLAPQSERDIRLQGGNIARYRGVEGFLGASGVNLTVLEAGDLAVGDDWAEVRSAPNILGGAATVQSEFEVQELPAEGNSLARISVRRTASARSGATAESAAFELKKFRGEGEIVFDAAVGRLVSETTRDETVLHVAVPDSPPQDVRTTSETTIRVQDATIAD